MFLARANETDWLGVRIVQKCQAVIKQIHGNLMNILDANRPQQLLKIH